MVSGHVQCLCLEKETVSSLLANNPSLPPGEAVKKLYGHASEDLELNPEGKRPSASTAAVRMAEKCGNWGPTKPSDLFLQAFADSLNCLDSDPVSGMVSPPLMGSHGTVPLTVIAPLADIIRHCSNLIVRAEREVFFITCSWAPSVAQRLLKNSLTELSRRAGERGQRVVVKMMYDKAAAANAIDPHQVVHPSTWSSKGIQLPSPEEIPHLDMEVISFHRLFLGTLHAKFCIVDRKIGVVMSNNMEDNDNVEMMTQVEGPIVDSLYDTALITWNKPLSPPLPSHNSPATGGGLETNGNEPLYLDRGPGRKQHEIAADGHANAGMAEHTPEDPHYDSDIAGEIRRMQSCYSMKLNETRLEAANRQLNLAVKMPVEPNGPDIMNGQEMTPYIDTSTSYPIPMVLVSRPPYGGISHRNVNVPQNEAWLSLIRNAEHNIFIQTPDLNAPPLVPAIADALKRGVEVTYYVCFGYNDAGEIIPGQGGTNDQVAHALVSSLPEKERALLHIYNYVGKDQDHPIHQSLKQRSCHIKLLIVDSYVGIQGSGNQDTQSWYHSQELNVMIDSQEICERWREGIERNQNTKEFGEVAEDGIWRDGEGKTGEGYMGNPGVVEGLFKGVAGMVRKMRNVGAI